MWTEIQLAIEAGLAYVVGLVKQARTKGARALEHPVRKRLYELVRRRPGRRLHELWRELDIPRETTQYHLVVLERSGAIDSTRAEGNLRFFPADTKEIDALAVLMRGRTLELVDWVARNPGATQKQLVEILNVSRKTFRDYANRLIDQDLISERRKWRECQYFPTPRLVRTLPVAIAAFDEPSEAGGSGGVD